MNQYQRLTPDERYVIETGLRENLKRSAIARMIGRPASTVTREIQRNESQNGIYRSKTAQKQTLVRSKTSHLHVRITPEHWEAVETCLREEHSPEQISGRLKTTLGLSICYEMIYRHIAKDAKSGGDLYLHLRQRKKVRRPRCRKVDDRRGQICNRIGIEERPAVVDERSRAGDWEIDTIVSRESKHVLVTAVERTTLATIIQLVPTREARAVTDALIRRLSPYKQAVLTITADNGKEFAYHEKVAKKLSALFFFARPYHSWERGTNENTNGLIRQYFPKKTDFSKITKAQVAAVEWKLNNRPRKSLNYKTAAEYFCEQTGLPLPAGRGKGLTPEDLYNDCTFALAS